MREAQHLSKLCKSVTIVHRRDSLRAQSALQNLVKSKPNIKFIWNTEVIECLGDEKIKAVKLKDVKSGKIKEMPIDGLFVAIGHKPNVEFLKGQLELDKGYIKVKNETHASVDGVFVAGDVSDYHFRQAVTAAGAGCKATMDVEEYLEANV